MNKKCVKILLINILAIFTAFFLFEAYFLYETTKDFPERRKNPYVFNMRQFDESFRIFEKDWMRKPSGTEYNKKTLVIFGGSFGYGSALSKSKTVSYKLSEYLKKPVYNRAYPGGCPSQMLFQLQMPDFFEKVPKADYVLYIYTEDEMPRLYRHMAIMPSNDLFPRYKLKNGKVEKVNTSSFLDKFWYLYSVRQIHEKVVEPFLIKNQKKTFDLFSAILIESKAIIDKHWDNPKFIILKYPIYRTDRDNKPDCSEPYTYYEGWDKLKEAGFEVVDMQSLVGNAVCSPDYIVSVVDDYHPNEKAWDKIIPILVEKENIK